MFLSAKFILQQFRRMSSACGKNFQFLQIRHKGFPPPNRGVSLPRGSRSHVPAVPAAFDLCRHAPRQRTPFLVPTPGMRYTLPIRDGAASRGRVRPCAGRVGRPLGARGECSSLKGAKQEEDCFSIPGSRRGKADCPYFKVRAKDNEVF